MAGTSHKLHENTGSPKVHFLRIAAERSGQRLDNFLLGVWKGAPKSLVYRLIRTGQVRINGKRAKPESRLSENDQIRIPPVRLSPVEEKILPSSTQLHQIEQCIVFEDRNFLVLDKPAGLASHGGSGIHFGAIELLRKARPNDTLELVHRLDRDTSGILVFARKRSALTQLQSAIRLGAVRKNYLALLQNPLPQSNMRIDAPLLKFVLQGGERMVRVDSSGKESVTSLRMLENYGIAALCEATLETGRTHQIRVHCQHSGHPIAGDEKYGDREFNQQMRGHELKRLFLHAIRFEFELVEPKQDYSFSTPLPSALRQVLEQLAKKT